MLVTMNKLIIKFSYIVVSRESYILVFCALISMFDRYHSTQSNFTVLSLNRNNCHLSTHNYYKLFYGCSKMSKYLTSQSKRKIKLSDTDNINTRQAL